MASPATQTPEQALAAAHVAAVDEMEPLRDLAGRLQALDATISRAAQLADADQLVLAAEHLLPLHVEFARTYRSWLARRTIGQPPFVPLGGPDSMSV
jgi:hypothetical protein